MQTQFPRSQAEVPPHIPPSWEKDGEPRVRWWRRHLKALVVAVTLVVVAGAAGGVYLKLEADADADRAEAAYQHELRERRHDLADWRSTQQIYSQTVTATTPAFDAIDEFEGKISAGLNLEEHSDAYADVSSEIGGTIRALPPEAMDVAIALEEVDQEYFEANDIWVEWFNDLYDTRSVNELPTEEHWNAASDAYYEAQNAVDALEPAARPKRPAEGENYRPHVPAPGVFGDGGTGA